MTTLPEIIGALITDALELTGWHGGSIAGLAIVRYFRRRDQQARDILFEELRRANISEVQAASEDDAIAVIVRYLRAAREGVARLNLRLLAQAIAGKLRAGQLVAEEFLQYAEALASLSRDEIIVIGAMYRVWAAHQALAATDPAEANRRYYDPWGQALKELIEQGIADQLVFASASRAQRSGLIYGRSTTIETVGTSEPTSLHKTTTPFVYYVSPLLIDLGKTVDFDEALRREASERE